MKIEDFYKNTLRERGAQLMQSATRLDAIGDFAQYRLGESCRRVLLTAACPSLDISGLNHDEVKAQVQKLFDGAVVLKSTKRAAVIALGDIICLAGLYGVVTFELPIVGWPLSSFSWSRQSVFDNQDLLKKIGAFSNTADRHGSIFDYTQCVVQRCAEQLAS